MEKLTVLILVEGEDKPIVGEWIADSEKAECIEVQGKVMWFPKSVCMGGLRSRNYSDDMAAAIDEYVAGHEEVEAGHVYCLRMPVWLANEKEIPGFDDEIPENVTVVEHASKVKNVGGFIIDGEIVDPKPMQAPKPKMYSITKYPFAERSENVTVSDGASKLLPKYIMVKSIDEFPQGSQPESELDMIRKENPIEVAAIEAKCIDVAEKKMAHKASCKMCGHPTDGDRLCDACKQAVSQERHSDLQRLLRVHQVDCVEDLPKGVLWAHQRRHNRSEL